MHSVIVPLAANAEKVARWNSRKGQFLKQLPELLKGLRPATVLSEKEANQLCAERDEYKTEFEKADSEIATLIRQMSELEKANRKSGGVRRPGVRWKIGFSTTMTVCSGRIATIRK